MAPSSPLHVKPPLRGSVSLSVAKSRHSFGLPAKEDTTSDSSGGGDSASLRSSLVARHRSKRLKPFASSPAAINSHFEPASSVPATQAQQIMFLGFNLVSAIAVTFINKACFARIQFDYPAMLANIHFISTWLCVELLRQFKLFKPMTRRPSLKDPNFLAIVVVVGLVTPLNNSSLQLNGVGFYQIFKLLVTPVVVFLEYVLDGKLLSVTRSTCLAVVCTSVFVSSRAALDFSWAGLLCASMWLPLAAAKKVQWGRVMKKLNVSSTLALMHVVLPYAIVVQCIVSPLVDKPGVFQYQWTPEAVMWISLSGASAFLVNYSGFLVVGRVGALSHALLGQIKTTIVMVVATLMFGETYTPVQIYGAMGSVVGIVAYSKASIAEKAAIAKQKQEMAEGQKLSKHANKKKSKDEVHILATIQSSLAEEDSGGQEGDIEIAERALREPLVSVGSLTPTTSDSSGSSSLETDDSHVHKNNQEWNERHMLSRPSKLNQHSNND